jgi:hypothetical protein
MKVNIVYNNDAGNWQYSIACSVCSGCWMDSFPTLEEAISFCEYHRLTIVEYWYNGVAYSTRVEFENR